MFYYLILRLQIVTPSERPSNWKRTRVIIYLTHKKKRYVIYRFQSISVSQQPCVVAIHHQAALSRKTPVYRIILLSCNRCNSSLEINQASGKSVGKQQRVRYHVQSILRCRLIVREEGLRRDQESTETRMDAFKWNNPPLIHFPSFKLRSKQVIRVFVTFRTDTHDIRIYTFKNLYNLSNTALPVQTHTRHVYTWGKQFIMSCI